MTDMTSMATPLMQRTVCEDCGHFHSRILRTKCPCCTRDYEQVYGKDGGGSDD